MSVRRIHHFAARSAFEKLWCGPAWLLLGGARAALLWLPFRRLAPKLGQRVEGYAQTELLSQAQLGRARQIARTVALAARFTPWVANCLPQALVAMFLLRLYRLRYRLYLGLAPGAAGEPMQAHAWVRTGRVCVTGGHSFEHYTVVACFAGGGGGGSET